MRSLETMCILSIKPSSKYDDFIASDDNEDHHHRLHRAEVGLRSSRVRANSSEYKAHNVFLPNRSTRHITCEATFQNALSSFFGKANSRPLIGRWQTKSNCLFVEMYRFNRFNVPNDVSVFSTFIVLKILISPERYCCRPLAIGTCY